MRSPGESRPTGLATWSALSPNFASRVRTSAGDRSGSCGLERVAERQVLGEPGAGLVDLADGHRRAEAGACPCRARSRPSRRRSSVVLPAPLGPVMPIRSRALTCSEAGPNRKSPRCRRRLVEGRDDRARPGRGADAELQHPLLARLLDLVEPGDPRLHLAHLLGLLLRRLGRGLAADLVVVGALLHRVADALRAPLALGARPRRPGRPSCRRTRRTPRARAGGPPRAPRGTSRSRRRTRSPGAGRGRARRCG